MSLRDFLRFYEPDWFLSFINIPKSYNYQRWGSVSGDGGHSECSLYVLFLISTAASEY